MSAFRDLFAARYGEDKLRQADAREVYWKATFDSERTIWNYRGAFDADACRASNDHEEAIAAIRALTEKPDG